ncbi:acyl-coenzyme A thioesterase 1-like [Hyalella azteca]|uniref:Acyl-coenzyme A thioesterase 1-like n=1 Tax=Hyalella azteca TaxID=294128 RepID=A0A8B7PJE2_HYAAZ|nr:acyl-coenzyme A thioesterase 1-like [Hyalella azteca]
MYGSAGGLRELRPAVLAARGFAVLSLAFFGYEDLVPDLTHQLDTAYFQEAVDFVLHHKKVIKNGVGVMGFSKAGDIVLSLGADIPEVKAVISLNGCVSNIFGSMRFKDGSVIEGLYGDNSRILITPEGAGDGTHLVNNPLDYPKTIIPIEKIKCKVLWFTSLDDKNFRGTEMVQIIKQLLRERNPEALEKYWEFMEGPNAGHVIEPPYLPYTSASYHRLVNGVMIWGGSAVDHSIAEVKLWKRIQEVLRQELIPAE